MSKANAGIRGIGMTSARTRDRLVQRLVDQGIRSKDVLEQIRNVPRHLFVDEALASRAYEDTALPIGMGQTISQPYTVALMSQVLLEGTRPRKVLEVGSGSGYQAAILAQLVEKVYGVERIESLVHRAEACIRKLRLHNVYLRHRNGKDGWPERAPFDAILVAAAAAVVPQKLVEQLRHGGKLLVPVGSRDQQHLVVVQRNRQGFEQRTIEKVSFVPLLGGLR